MEDRIFNYIVRRVNQRAKDHNLFTTKMLLDEIKTQQPDIDLKLIRDGVKSLVNSGKVKLGETINHNYFIL